MIQIGTKILTIIEEVKSYSFKYTVGLAYIIKLVNHVLSLSIGSFINSYLTVIILTGTVKFSETTN